MATNSTNKRKTTSKTATKKSTKAKTATKKAVSNNVPFMSREAWGITYVVLAVITVLSILNFDGFLLGMSYKAITFCVGYGIYVLPFSLMAMCIYCFVPFRGNAPLRCASILFLPISIGCFVQTIFDSDKYSLNTENIATIIEKAFLCESAGFVGGFLSIILKSSLSSFGAIILIFALIVIEILIGFRISIKQVVNTFIEAFNQLKVDDYEEKLEEDMPKYELTFREKKRAKKEKQKEYQEKLREQKQQAYDKFKEEIKEEQLRKPKNFDINFTLKEPETVEKLPTSIDNIPEESKPQVEAWLVDMYEQLKKRDALEKIEKQNKQKTSFSQTEDISFHKMEEIAEISLNDESTTPVIALHKKYTKTDSKDFAEGIVIPMSNTVVLTDVANDIARILNENQSNDTEPTTFSNIDDYIDESEIPVIQTNTTEIETTFNNIEETDEKELSHQIPESFDLTTIKQAIEENIDEITRSYTFSKEQIIPDLLKSTMKYEFASNFDKENLEYKYAFPSINLLKPPITAEEFDPNIELAESSERLVDTLESFNIKSEIVNIIRGPSITRFEITIGRGTKFSKLDTLSTDIALSLNAVSVFISTIPEKGLISIEIPNKTTEIVLIRQVLDSQEFKNTTSKLSYALGYDIAGKPAIGDIAKMPHMLIAGTTGSGKSVCVNSMIISLLYKADPTEVKFIMIDPKMVELGGYNGIPHLLIPVVTDPKKAAGALNWAVGEMMKRYDLLAKSNVKNLEAYNNLMEQKIANGDTEAEKLPQIVIIIDELADLMMVAAKEIEESICRIAQMARAAGMHLVIATQRPSSDVITGIMKSNVPSRISFAVSSQMDSRIILDVTGAEKLIGKGDMLYSPLGYPKPHRLQGCFISSTEVEAVVDYVKSIAEPNYNEEVMSHIENHATVDSSSSGSSDGDVGDEDPIIDEAIDIIISTGQASTSFLQRKLRLGYARASRVIDQIEDRGIISPPDGSKPRQILITKQQWQEMKIRKMD